jgi:hypothetical protein
MLPVIKGMPPKTISSKLDQECILKTSIRSNRSTSYKECITKLVCGQRLAENFTNPVSLRYECTPEGQGYNMVTTILQARSELESSVVDDHGYLILTTEMSWSFMIVTLHGVVVYILRHQASSFSNPDLISLHDNVNSL